MIEHNETDILTVGMLVAEHDQLSTVIQGYPDITPNTSGFLSLTSSTLTAFRDVPQHIQNSFNADELIKTYPDQKVFTMNVVLTILLLGVSYFFLKQILKMFGCSDVHPENTHTKSRTMTKQWLILSTILTGYLGIHSFSRHGYFINTVSCDVVRSYNLSELTVPGSIITGYLMYDLLFNGISYIYMLHHILGAIPIILFVFYNDSIGGYYSDVLMTLEISTVFLNFRSMLPESSSNVMSALFMISFMIIRPLYLPFVAISISNCSKGGQFYEFIIASFTVLCIINYYWATLILFKVKRMIFGGLQHKKIKQT